MPYLGRKFFHRIFDLNFRRQGVKTAKHSPHLASLELHQQAVQEIARLRTQLEEECNCIASLTYLCMCRKVYLCLLFVTHFVHYREAQCAHGRILTFLLCHQDRSLSTRLVAISSESRPAIGLHLLLKKLLFGPPTFAGIKWKKAWLVLVHLIRMFFVTLRLSGMPYVHRRPCIFFLESTFVKSRLEQFFLPFWNALQYLPSRANSGDKWSAIIFAICGAFLWSCSAQSRRQVCKVQSELQARAVIVIVKGFFIPWLPRDILNAGGRSRPQRENAVGSSLRTSSWPNDHFKCSSWGAGHLGAKSTAEGMEVMCVQLGAAKQKEVSVFGQPRALQASHILSTELTYSNCSQATCILHLEGGCCERLSGS